jgi:hypothetical protein
MPGRAPRPPLAHLSLQNPRLRRNARARAPPAARPRLGPRLGHAALGLCFRLALSAVPVRTPIPLSAACCWPPAPIAFSLAPRAPAARADIPAGVAAGPPAAACRPPLPCGGQGRPGLNAPVCLGCAPDPGPRRACLAGWAVKPSRRRAGTCGRSARGRPPRSRSGLSIYPFRVHALCVCVRVRLVDPCALPRRLMLFLATKLCGWGRRPACPWPCAVPRARAAGRARPAPLPQPCFSAAWGIRPGAPALSLSLTGETKQTMPQCNDGRPCVTGCSLLSAAPRALGVGGGPLSPPGPLAVGCPARVPPLGGTRAAGRLRAPLNARALARLPALSSVRRASRTGGADVTGKPTGAVGGRRRMSLRNS